MNARTSGAMSLVALLAGVLSCSDGNPVNPADSSHVQVTVTSPPAPPSPPPRARQELYDLVATFTKFTYAGPRTSDVNATIVGELALVDTVEYRDGEIIYRFPMTLTGTFCYEGTGCGASPKLWPGRSSMGPGGLISITLYRENYFVSPVLFFSGTLAADTISGTASYLCCSDYRDQYDGTFVARKKT